MGSCLSTTKVNGSNSNSTTTTTTNTALTAIKNQRKEPAKSVANTAPKNDGSHQKQTQKRNEIEVHGKIHKNNNNNNVGMFKPREKTSSRRQGAIPCGKRTDFGYDKDFEYKYTIGKLLGHGQFGYTYVATDKSNGDRVAVKKIDKSKVLIFFIIFLILILRFFFFFFFMCLFYSGLIIVM